MMNPGKTIVLIGVALALVGVLVMGLERVPWVVSWFGRLPGDIRYEGERTFVFVPLTSMLLVSVIVSLVLYLIRRMQ